MLLEGEHARKSGGSVESGGTRGRVRVKGGSNPGVEERARRDEESYAEECTEEGRVRRSEIEMARREERYESERSRVLQSKGHQEEDDGEGPLVDFAAKALDEDASSSSLAGVAERPPRTVFDDPEQDDRGGRSRTISEADLVPQEFGLGQTLRAGKSALEEEITEADKAALAAARAKKQKSEAAERRMTAIQALRDRNSRRGPPAQ